MTLEDIRQRDFNYEAQINLQRFAFELGKYVPDPTNIRLLDPDADYTPMDLQGFLQTFTAYISNLAALKRRMEAELLIQKRSAKNYKQLVISQCSGRGSVSSQISEAIASEQGTRILEDELGLIKQESCLTFLKGWLEAYQQAYAGASRCVEVLKAESQATGGNGRFQ